MFTGVAESVLLDFRAATQPEIMTISGSRIKRPPGKRDGLLKSTAISW
jgi:hypothetical protein